MNQLLENDRDPLSSALMGFVSFGHEECFSVWRLVVSQQECFACRVLPPAPLLWRVALPLPVKSCKCRSFECVSCHSILIIYNPAPQEAFLLRPAVHQSVPSLQPSGKSWRCISLIFFFFSGREFIAAEPERPLNSQTRPDACGRESNPAAMRIVLPLETDSHGFLNISSHIFKTDTKLNAKN